MFVSQGNMKHGASNQDIRSLVTVLIKIDIDSKTIFENNGNNTKHSITKLRNLKAFFESRSYSPDRDLKWIL